MRLLSAMAALSLTICSAGVPSISFDSPRTFAADGAPVSLATADFNGDGTPDLAVANIGSPNVSILLGKGDGTFQPAVNYATGGDTQSVALGDFNAGGKLDLVVANRLESTVSVLLGNGDGTFRAPVNYPAGIRTFFVA